MKYFKSFDTSTAMQNYYETAPGKNYYLFMDKSGQEGIGTNINSGKKIVSAYKPHHDYLTFTAVDAGATVKYNANTGTTAEYSLDNGATWTNAVGVTVTLQNVGDKVKYRGTITQNISSSSPRFTMGGTSKKVAASGSVMSMYNGNPDDTEIVYEGAFIAMFYNCSSLTTAPDLPATTLATKCYNLMFYSCSSLTAAPELPATTLATQCYLSMFYSCISLTTVSELPATTLVSNCYEQMFANCLSLTTAPELPATTLVWGCYTNMFTGCSSLTSAPELPATTLVSYCYSSMFNGCSKLNYVKTHVTSWNTNYASNWLSGTAASGIVECPTASTIPSDSTSGIPTGWTRQNF